jgi:hypothetical protein
MINRSVGAEVAALPRLTVKDLRTRHAEVFGEATKANRGPSPAFVARAGIPG